MQELGKYALLVGFGALMHMGVVALKRRWRARAGTRSLTHEEIMASPEDGYVMVTLSTKMPASVAHMVSSHIRASGVGASEWTWMALKKYITLFDLAKHQNAQLFMAHGVRSVTPTMIAAEEITEVTGIG